MFAIQLTDSLTQGPGPRSSWAKTGSGTPRLWALFPHRHRAQHRSCTQLVLRVEPLGLFKQRIQHLGPHVSRPLSLRSKLSLRQNQKPLWRQKTRH